VSGPWDKYQQPAPTPAAPWQKYGTSPPADAGSEADWHRDDLLPLEHNRRTGAWRMAVPGLVQGAWDAITLPGDVLSGKTPFDPRVPIQDQDPATLDRAASLAGVVAGEAPLASRNMVTAGARDIVDATGKRLPRAVTSSMAMSNLDPATVRAALDAVGPAAVLGDASPRLQALTGAVATTGGPGQDIIVNQLTKRALEANGRIKGAVGDIFGPEPVPSQVTGQIDAARKTANAAYAPVFAEKALSGATPAEAAYNAKPLAQAIDAALPQFVGETRNKVASVGKMLIDPSTGQLTKDPQVILSVRSELDGMIGELSDQRGSKTTISALSDLRKMVDEDLALQVPGVKWADAGRAEVHQQEEAFQLGRDALKNGDSAVHPVDLKAELDRFAGPAGSAIGPRATPSLAPQRVSEGMLSRIYQAIGVTANDRVALKQLLKGDGSWNREKMDAVFGSEKAQKFVDLLDAEAKMAATENLAFGNSKTEVLRSAKEGIEPSKTAPGVIRSAGNLNFGDAALGVVDKVLGGAIKGAATRRNTAIAQALMANDGLRAAPFSVGVGSRLATSAVLQILSDRARQGGVLNGGGGGGF
jgi:hypothetical protein